MKIAVAGSHGTGKSTFARALAKEAGFNYIYDIVVEEAVKKGFQINENTPPEVQLWLVARQWELEKLTPAPWIADKSLFDYLIYGDFALKEEEVKSVIKKIIEKNANYDTVFYLPIEFAMEKNGIRSEDEDFRQEIDRRYKKYLDSRGIKYVVLTGSVQERVDEARRHLSRK